MQELISVIVPVYNVEKYLEKCVNSILSQSYKNIEIILVDDGSTDLSGEICDLYSKDYPNIKTIHKKNGGLSSARNAGLDIARGQYIGFVDSDDWVKESMYENMYRNIKSSGCDIATCGMLLSDGNKQKEYKNIKKKKVYTRDRALIEILLERDLDVSACNKLYNANLFRDIRYPEGENNEDAAVIMDIMSKVKEIIHIGTPEYFYFQRKGSISNTPSDKNLLDQYNHALQINEIVLKKYNNLKQYSEFYIFTQIVTILKCLLFNFNKKDIFIKYYLLLKDYDIKKNKKLFGLKRKILFCVIVFYYKIIGGRNEKSTNNM